MKNIILFLLLCHCASCFSFPKLGKHSFDYNVAGRAAYIAVMLPKGFKTGETITDSSGAQVKRYTYGDGAELYFARMRDTFTMIRSIDTSRHIPGITLRGATMYKGIEKDYTFWREVRKGFFRVGYRNVTVPVEPRFDSAVNNALEKVEH